MRDGADHVMTVEYDTKEYRPIYGSVQYLEKGNGLSRTLTQHILRLPNESDFLLISNGGRRCETAPITS